LGWEEYLERIVGVRQQLIDGDLRPLYVAWMCGCRSDEVDPDSAYEPPVPAGLAESSDSITGMLDYFDLSPFMLAAAAEQSPPLPHLADQKVAMVDWLDSLDTTTLHKWILRFLTGEPTAIRTECLQACRKWHKIPPWPVVKGTRTLAQLVRRANELAEEEQVREENRKERARRKRLADMARSPQKYLDEVNEHVAMRGRQHNGQAAQILSEIREAIGGEKGDKVSRKHAAHLREKYPTLKMLIGALRRKGLLS
jgi:hypothetical protein